MKSIIFKIAIIAVILVAGWLAVFNIPETVESFLPSVETVSLEPAEYHQIVSGSGVVMQSELDENWYVTVFIGERDIRRVKIGQSATLSGAAFDDGIYTASVYNIGDVAFTRQGTFNYETVIEVTLRIDNPDDERATLRSGNSARANIQTGDTENIFIIPYSAIMQDDIGEFVFVQAGHTVIRRDILTGAELPEGAQILAGLSEYDQIIITPELVSEGQLTVNESGDTQ
ncbi:MAG: HlyD family efflux transporter periplasmic adaptor subunit [Oscillospiraceae bacterium]|nr:HlyD family efflux transporter periplasmic adaptor subunit [Oscillospiraceae bacterium]